MSGDKTNSGRRRFLTAATTVVGAIGTGFVLVPFISSMQPSAKARAAGAPVRADLSKIEPGQMVRVKWRGKPVWLVRRTDEMLASLSTLAPKLSDPESIEVQQPAYAQNEYRSINLNCWSLSASAPISDAPRPTGRMSVRLTWEALNG